MVDHTSPFPTGDIFATTHHYSHHGHAADAAGGFAVPPYAYQQQVSHCIKHAGYLAAYYFYPLCSL
jgi:hypothetical protein